MPTPEFLHDLLTAAGPSGHETSPARVWRDWCSRFCGDVGADRVGSSWARIGGIAGGPNLAVVGHIDEIGLHVTYIDDDGFIRFDEVGGWDPAVLIGQRLAISTKHGTLAGVIGRKPTHLLKDEESKKVPEIKDLHIDIGAANGDEARERIRIGDVAVIDVAPLEMPNDRVVSRALDNRVGCYVAARAAQLVAEAGGAPGDFVAMAVAQEETTFAGARTSAFAHEPEVAIAVDVTFATDQPGIELGPIAKHTMGSGPVICRGTSLHPRIFELLYETGQEQGIPFTIESQGRYTGTDADAINFSRKGVATGLVSVPLRYMHSPVEMVAIDDIENAARLIAGTARRLTAEVSLER